MDKGEVMQCQYCHEFLDADDITDTMYRCPNCGVFTEEKEDERDKEDMLEV